MRLVHNEESQQHWIVRLLRLFGYIVVFGATLSGLVWGITVVGPLHGTMYNHELTRILGYILGIAIGVIVGFCAGILGSLVLWCLALLIDDIHAIRINTDRLISGASWDYEEQPTESEQPQPQPNENDEEEAHFIGEIPPQFNYRTKMEKGDE